MRYKKAVLKAILLFSLLLTAVPIHSAMAEEDTTLLCPCGCAMIISACDCPTAVQIKKEISKMNSTGFSGKQITSALQAEYGSEILVRPEKKDPALLWIGRILLVPILVFLGYILARRSGRGITPDTGKYERRFKEEYRNFVFEQEKT